MLIKAGVDVVDKIEFPCEVFHPDAEGSPRKFKNKGEAKARAKFWNQEVPGHRVRKRNLTC